MTSTNPEFPITLTIAGSDSSGGAGIQADLKTFSALRTYGASVITAITAQNTLGVSAVHTIPAEIITAQLHSVFEDLDVKAVKIGMLSEPDVIEAVSSALKHYRPEHIVLDPVMIAKSGDALLQETAVETLKQQLIPLATLITPNLPEAGVLLNQPEAKNLQEMERTLEQLTHLGAKMTLLKGGHLEGHTCHDLLAYGNQTATYTHERISTKNTHGTGCTLSSAITAYLAQGFAIETAVEKATDYVHKAIINSHRLAVGKGHGPLLHCL